MEAEDISQTASFSILYIPYSYLGNLSTLPSWYPTSYHQVLLRHSGVCHILTMLQNHYWIPQAREASYHLPLGHALHAKKVERRSYEYPIQSALPDFRLSCSATFEYTGVDIFGPISTFYWNINAIQYTYLEMKMISY